MKNPNGTEVELIYRQIGMRVEQLPTIACVSENGDCLMFDPPPNKEYKCGVLYIPQAREL
jgi:hypothetical protein